MSDTSAPDGTAFFTPKSLAGHWRARRHIEDARAGGTAYLSGVAVFSQTGPQDMTYREGGRLFMPNGQVFEASRTYLWKFPATSPIQVCFEDGRLFHLLDPSELGKEITHLCGEDTYRGTITIDGDQEWTTIWTVKGPRKDQQLTTRYART
ncbi:MAG: DUF6314 family protein [Pseudomonadota bacterium]